MLDGTIGFLSALYVIAKMIIKSLLGFSTDEEPPIEIENRDHWAITQMFLDFTATMFFIIIALDRLLGLPIKQILIHYNLVDYPEKPYGICKIIGGTILYSICVIIVIPICLIALLILCNSFKDNDEGYDGVKA